MQRTIFERKTQHQATGRVLVIRVIFDDDGVSRRLANFQLGNIALDGAPQGMTGKFKLPGGQLLADLLKGFHYANYTTFIAFRCDIVPMFFGNDMG